MTNISSQKLCNVAILAGGRGTRLQSRSGKLPKPMVDIFGKPVLLHQIELCSQYNFTDIALLVHYQSSIIQEFFGDGRKFGVNIKYIYEKEARGTAGALVDSIEFLDSNFLVLYADTFLNVDLRTFFETHINQSASATIFVHPNDHPHDSDIIELNSNSFVTKINPYPHPPNLVVNNLVNAALYAISKDSIIEVSLPKGKTDIAKELFPEMLRLQHTIYGYKSAEYIKDMGTPDRLDKVFNDINYGLPERLSRNNLKSAVFLDRDGTIIREVNHLTNASQIDLLPDVSKAINILNRSGFLALMVTNQPVLARGLITFDDLNAIHNKLECELGRHNAYLDNIYFCPHHPHSGFPGEIKSLKKNCSCRKPNTGLLDQACKDYLIKKDNSWIIGDTTSDIEAGRRAGVRSILVQTGYGGTDNKFSVRPDYVAINLLDAVNWITFGHSKARKAISSIGNKFFSKKVILIGGQARSGKSYISQVIKEYLNFIGIKAHIICLDGWLKSADLRSENSGVLERYDMVNIVDNLLSLINNKQRVSFLEPVYNRKTRMTDNHFRHSIGIDDVLIIEGVPALELISYFSDINFFSIYVEIEESIRRERIRIDYLNRGYLPTEIESIISSRLIDESRLIESKKSVADHIFEME